MNQTCGSGSLFFRSIFSYGHKSILSLTALTFSLFLVGSCNEQVTLFDFSKKPLVLASLEKGDLLRYSYAVQTALIQSPDVLRQLRRQDLQLALSAPDLNREDGKGRVWQYRTPSCVLNIYWRRGDNQKTADYYEVTARRSLFDHTEKDDAHSVQSWQCLQSIIQYRRQQIEEGFQEDYAVLSLKAQRS